MSKFTIHEAKTKLSQLLKRSSQGESVIIVNRNTPVAKLVPVGKAPRELGFISGELSMSEDFNEALKDFSEYEK